MIATLGSKAVQDVVNAGRFGRFVWHTTMSSLRGCTRSRTYPLIWNQMNIIGVRSVPVIMITGAFVGMTLAVQAYDQLAGMGLEEHLGVLINISVVKELGPVLAAVMLAGRIGGALTAELGTMNVTEQIDAVRSMGTDPIRYLVVPRLLACLLLTPVLIIYADLMGVVGGAVISFLQLGINSRAYWHFSAYGVELWDVAIGVVKGFFFGGAGKRLLFRRSYRYHQLLQGFYLQRRSARRGAGLYGGFCGQFHLDTGRGFCPGGRVQECLPDVLAIKEPRGITGSLEGPNLEQGTKETQPKTGKDRSTDVMEVKDLVKRFGEKLVLDRISLSVEKGKTTAVIGPSGCGKTVLIKHFIALLRPTEGQVYFKGQRIDDRSERELSKIRTQFGYLFQEGALFDSMTVAENIMFPIRQHYKIRRWGEVEDLVKAKLAMVGLDGFQNYHPANLSGGQRKRVALARAIALNPEVILYDEPTTGLDPIRADIINSLCCITARSLPMVTPTRSETTLTPSSSSLFTARSVKTIWRFCG